MRRISSLDLIIFRLLLYYILLRNCVISHKVKTEETEYQASTMPATDRPLKIYFLPFFAQGHMIPLSQFARLFAAHGVHVTIITTPSNANFLQKSIDKGKASGHHIDIYAVEFPSNEVGLPPGLENLSCATNSATARKIFQAANLVRKDIEPFVMQSPPDCIVSDFIYKWTAELSERLEIPRLIFNSFSLFVVCMTMEAVKRHCDDDEFTSSSSPFVVDGLPQNISMTLKPPKQFIEAMEPLLEAELKSHGLIVNNFAELEGECVEHYKKITGGHKAWLIGPVSLMLKNIDREKEESMEDHQHECLRWLDSKKPNSVLYIGFGSLTRFSDAQLLEMAYGLESSEHQFIWVVHRQDKEDGNNEDDKKWLPEGFEQRMKKENKGKIIRGWAPQGLILNHSAIGGFLTHCGWSSVMEGISAGVPMITLPVFWEQFFNEKLITQVHGFGVEVGAVEWGINPYEYDKKLVCRDRIEKAVRRMMDSGDEAEEIRKRAEDMGEKARKAIEEGGSSKNNLMALIEDLKRMQATKI